MNWRLVEPLIPFTGSALTGGSLTIIVWREPGGPDSLWLTIWLLSSIWFLLVMAVCVVVYERRRRDLERRRQ